MDAFRECSFVSCAPLLDESNYGYWKARMIAFIKSVDNKTQKLFINGSSPPTKLLQDGVTSVKKAIKEWDTTKDEAVLVNSNALNAIYNEVDVNVFRLVNTCVSAKEACKILEISNEGTDKMNNSRFKLVTTKVENMKMLEEEAINDFYVRVESLSNESYSLGKLMSDDKLVKKILCSLLQRFKINTTTIEEVHDTSKS